MSQNRLPAGIQDLLKRAEKIAQGLIAHGPWIGLNQVTSEQIESAIQQLNEAQESYTNALNDRNLAGKRVAMADKALKSWLGKARLTVMLARGSRWSESWIHTGFTHRRTDIPKRAESRIALGRALISFFARHPEFNVPFASVTAAHGRSVYDRLTQSQQMLHVFTIDCRNAMHRRDNSRNALADLIHQTIGLLEVMLNNSDPRWADFGLAPRRSRRPESGRDDVARPGYGAIPFVAADEEEEGSRKIAAA